MSDFKVGDEIYFILNASTRNILFPICLHIEQATIEELGQTALVAIYGYIEPDNEYVLRYREQLWKGDFYKTKQECIDAFKKRLDQL